MLFEEEIKNGNAKDFCIKVTEISKQLGIDPNWLMTVMYFESGLNSKAVNQISGAVGLIQFMPSTAKNLGTTSENLRAMSNVEQLDYVYDYLSVYKGKMKSLVDVYFAVFFPSAINKPDSYVLETQNISAEKIATQNKIFDKNKDSVITKGEVSDYLNNWVTVKLNGYTGNKKNFPFLISLVVLGIVLYNRR